MTELASAAERMDGIYRRQRFIYDATRRYYLLGRDHLIADLRIPGKASVLEIGCGTGRNLILAARRYPGAQLCGLDVSEVMLRTARTSVARAGLSERIQLAAGDATAFDAAALFGAKNFERVLISYALSMIPAWTEVVKSAAACVAAGGALLIIDFGDFAGYPAVVQRAQHAWLRHFSVTPIPEFEKRISALAAEIGFTCATERLYGGYAIEASLQRR